MQLPTVLLFNPGQFNL